MIIEKDLKAIIAKYKLTQDELYKYNDTIMLISARGIRKIITTEKLNVSKRIIIDANGIIAVIARVEKNNNGDHNYIFYESIGEAKLGLNTTFRFPVSVAEARATSRAILMSLGLYEKGIIGEMELDMEVEAETIAKQRKDQADLAMKNLSNNLRRKE